MPEPVRNTHDDEDIENDPDDVDHARDTTKSHPLTKNATWPTKDNWDATIRKGRSGILLPPVIPRLTWCRTSSNKRVEAYLLYRRELTEKAKFTTASGSKAKGTIQTHTVRPRQSLCSPPVVSLPRPVLLPQNLWLRRLRSSSFAALLTR